MNSLLTASIIFAAIFIASLAAMALRRMLPKHHLIDDSKEVVRLVMGVVATMAGLILGLLIASAKSSYDTQSGEIVQLSAEIIQLDRMLSAYGPGATEVRAKFRNIVEVGINRIWPSENSRSVNLALPENADQPIAVFTLISDLDPQTNGQRFAQARALEILTDLSRTRVLMNVQSGSAMPSPFLVVLAFWLLIIFMGFGLYAPTNATVLVTLCVGALSVAGALFLILELGNPYEGVMRISSAPLRAAASQMGR